MDWFSLFTLIVLWVFCGSAVSYFAFLFAVVQVAGLHRRWVGSKCKSYRAALLAVTLILGLLVWWLQCDSSFHWLVFGIQYFAGGIVGGVSGCLAVGLALKFCGSQREPDWPRLNLLVFLSLLMAGCLHCAALLTQWISLVTPVCVPAGLSFFFTCGLSGLLFPVLFPAMESRPEHSRFQPLDFKNT